MCSRPFVRPVLVNEVFVLPVSATIVVNEPTPIFRSILYPVIAAPPSFRGAVHESDTRVSPAAAVRLVGAPGTGESSCAPTLINVNGSFWLLNDVVM